MGTHTLIQLKQTLNSNQPTPPTKSSTCLPPTPTLPTRASSARSPTPSPTLQLRCRDRPGCHRHLLQGGQQGEGQGQRPRQRLHRRPCLWRQDRREEARGLRQGQQAGHLNALFLTSNVTK